MDVPMCFHGGVAHGVKETYRDLASVPEVMSKLDASRGTTMYRLGAWDSANECWSYHAEDSAA